jgi:DNA-binding transcriptional LysR family regulator
LISFRIRQLEEAYGVKLFERSGRRVALTDAGEVLLSYAEKVFTLIKEADSHLEDMKGIASGTLKICTGLTVGTYYLPPVITAFRQQYPNIDIQMKVKNKRGVIEDILSFTDDLGFVGNMDPHEHVVITPLWEDELVVIVSRTHALAKGSAHPYSALNGQAFILREKGPPPSVAGPEDAATGDVARREHVVLCGYGRVGQNIARVLESQGFELIAVGRDQARGRAAPTPFFWGGWPFFYTLVVFCRFLYVLVFHRRALVFRGSRVYARGRQPTGGQPAHTA